VLDVDAPVDIGELLTLSNGLASMRRGVTEEDLASSCDKATVLEVGWNFAAWPCRDPWSSPSFVPLGGRR